MWLLLFASFCICAAMKLLLDLPAVFFTVPIVGDMVWFQKSYLEIEHILRDLRTKYGSIIKLHIGFRPAIFITPHELDHKALIQHGATFSERPSGIGPHHFVSGNQNVIGSTHSPLWRLLRKNLTSEILHPSRFKSYIRSRKWILVILTNRLKEQAKSGEPVCMADHFQYAMFCILVRMCFGEELDEKIIRDVQTV
uniref:Cytochrome P450 89A2-like n=1 Tax=Nelumbo nucifera TaxID=4432 RepID=A0A822Y0A8_NELNU|nr:TPA_asm: hypothetical protein HUJ06_026385 [Nelumbo nucifera]